MNQQLRTTVKWQLETVSPKSEEVRKITYEIIKLFLQNEPNFRESQMNVSDLISREYEKKDTWSGGKNEPKTNPNEPNYKKVKMNVTSYITKRYENISNWAICENEPKTNPILRARYKQMTNQSLTKLFLDTPVDCNLNFQAQRIDGRVQTGKISENVCFHHKGLCF